MSAVVLVLVGAVLCFLGVLSVRIGVLAAGFGATWLVADDLGASTQTLLVLSTAGAVVVFVVTLLVSRFLMFVAGVCAGAVIGARLLGLVTAGSADNRWLLALVFVPTVALLCGFLAETFEHRFLAWGTAFAGAALLLAGVGRIGTDPTDELWRPGSTVGAAALTVLWVGVTVGGHRVQRRRTDA